MGERRAPERNRSPQQQQEQQQQAEASQEQGDGIRARIVTEATRLFAAKGYAATSVREITQAAQVTNPMLYYYFGSKERLYSAIILESLESMSEETEALLQGPGAFEARLASLFTRNFEMVRGNPDLARLIFQVFFGPGQSERLTTELQTFAQAHRARMRAIVEREQASGGLSAAYDPDALLMCMSGLMTEPLAMYLHDEEISLSAELARMLARVFLQGAASRSGEDVASVEREEP